MDFCQEPPELDNSFRDDDVLRSYLRRTFGGPLPEDEAERLDSLGSLVANELYDLQLASLDQEAELVRWSPWGRRVDRIEHTDVWKRAEDVAREYDLVGKGYGETAHARLKQFARVYLFAPSTDTYTCPLAMTDGAVRTLEDSGNEKLVEEAVPHLKGEAEETWTSGQWMTETAGGSDVGRSNTTARQNGEHWELHGRKWFTSAIDSRVALALARPESSDDLALFYVRARDDRARPRNFRVTRLKDKLGTRELPTGETILEGTPAVPVDGLSGGVRNIYPMLNTTRTWNAVCSAAAMRRGLDLAQSYARKREVFGASLAEQPLHRSVVDRLEAETQGAFHLAFGAVDLLDAGGLLGRLMIPLAKLYTARQAVRVSTEILELFGGAGYVEDTGLPKLLRDTQVLPIWEGTTNVLSLEVLRQLVDAGVREELWAWFETLRGDVEYSGSDELIEESLTASRRLVEWVEENSDDGEQLEAQARNLSFGLAEAVEVASLAAQADWERGRDVNSGALEAARELAGSSSPGPGASTTPVG